ncbi:MAG: MFS transporter [Actinomycetes bacterium]
MSFLSDLRHVVRQKDFRRLYATRLSSQMADGVFQVSLASYVFFSPERQTSAGGVAAAFATLLLPYSLVGPFAGVLLDRWRRRQVLVVANVLRAGMVVGVSGLVAADVTGAPFYVAALVVLSVNRFFLAALSAALPHVVDRDDLVMANSVSTTSGTVAAVVGAGVGFLAREAIGKGDPATAAGLLLSSCLYVGSAMLAARMGRDLLGPDVDPAQPHAREALRRVARGILDGARHVAAHRQAAYALGAIAGHRFFYGVSTIATILLYRNTFHDSSDTDAALGGLAVVFVASGLGVLAAAALTPEVTPRHATLQRWIVICLGAAAVVQIALGAPYTEPLIVVAAFLLAIVSQSTKICVDTIVQQSIDDAYRGRVFSFYDVLFNVSFVSAAAFAALALPESGKSYPVLGVVAVGYAGVALAYARLTRRVVPEPVR